MNPDKILFLQNQMVPLLKGLRADAKGKWGLMNAQQMIEHYSDSLRIANGKAIYGVHTPKEH